MMNELPAKNPSDASVFELSFELSQTDWIFSRSANCCFSAFPLAWWNLLCFVIALH